MSRGRPRLRTALALRIATTALVVAVISGGLTSPGSPDATAAQPAAAPFKLEKGDHVCIIGNALAERMQHDGWLEAYLHARFPDHDLTIRNLGFSGDEVGGYTDKPDFLKRLR